MKRQPGVNRVTRVNSRVSPEHSQQFSNMADIDVMRPIAKQKSLTLTWGYIVVKSKERKYFPRMPDYADELSINEIAIQCIRLKLVICDTFITTSGRLSLLVDC